MGSKYPWFSFHAESYLSGKIMFQPLHAQGLFVQIISVIWRNEEPASIKDVKARNMACLSLVDEAIESLVFAGIIEVNDGMISVDFMTKLLKEMDDNRLAKSEAGKASAKARAKKRDSTDVEQNPTGVKQSSTPVQQNPTPVQQVLKKTVNNSTGVEQVLKKTANNSTGVKFCSTDIQQNPTQYSTVHNITEEKNIYIKDQEAQDVFADAKSDASLDKKIFSRDPSNNFSDWSYTADCTALKKLSCRPTAKTYLEWVGLIEQHSLEVLVEAIKKVPVSNRFNSVVIAESIGAPTASSLKNSVLEKHNARIQKANEERKHA